MKNRHNDPPGAFPGFAAPRATGVPTTFSDRIWKKFRQSRTARWSLRGIFILSFIALFADFIANERPLYCRLEGKTYFPVLRQYAVDLGWATWGTRIAQSDWHKLPYEKVIYPPIPYSASTFDRENRNYVGPFEKQKVKNLQFRHWLGTDKLGRDISAGLIRGTRVALSVGILAMSIAAVIGLFFGSLAGYFADDGWRVPRARLLFTGAGTVLSFFYLFGTRAPAIKEGHFAKELGISLLIIALFIALTEGISRFLMRWRFWQKPLAIPLDMLIMRLIEIINSIPTLLLLLAMVAVVKPSIVSVMMIIGFIGWTSIARFVRAELLRIRRLEYIQAAHVLGFHQSRILIRHALPNALTPVLITLAFGVAGAVLLEAFLSFLGLGLSNQSVTWGSMLNLARGKAEAWWLALFPGLAIFITVTLFNLVGEALTEAADPRSQDPQS